MDTIVYWRSLPESHGLQLYSDIDHHDRMTPDKAPVFGVCWLDVTGVLNFPMLVWFEIENRILCIYLTNSKQLWQKLQRINDSSFFYNSYDKVFKRNIQIKCTNIIIVQYTIVEHLPFIVQSHQICNKINIYHSPSQYWM